MVSSMVVALTNLLNMDMAEEKSHNVIMRLNIRQELKEEAAWILTAAAKLGIRTKKGIISKRESKHELAIIKKHTALFK